MSLLGGSGGSSPPRRRVVITLALALAVVVLAGCGSSKLSLQETNMAAEFDNAAHTAAVEVSEGGGVEPSTYSSLLGSEDAIVALCRKKAGAEVVKGQTVREMLEDDAASLRGGDSFTTEIADRLEQVAHDGCK